MAMTPRLSEDLIDNGAINCVELARYILHRAREQRIPVTNLKLQKILYYVQGHFLARFDKPLFAADIEAWYYGPCVPRAYFTFCNQGALPLICEQDGNIDGLSDMEKRLVNAVIDEKLRVKTGELVVATRAEDPWRLTVEFAGEQNIPIVIPIEDIKAYFKNLWKKPEDER